MGGKAVMSEMHNIQGQVRDDIIVLGPLAVTQLPPQGYDSGRVMHHTIGKMSVVAVIRKSRAVGT